MSPDAYAVKCICGDGRCARIAAGAALGYFVGHSLRSATGDDWLRSFALHPDASQVELRSALLQGPEGLDYDTLAAGFADLETSGRTIGDAPLVVLTGGRELEPAPPGVSPELAAQLAALHRETQPELLRLSSNSAQVVAANSGHFIQRDAPDLVVSAVHEVVDAARAHRHVDAGAPRP
jgi:pimeloyl-ACP methyl ester carboxylesterase